MACATCSHFHNHPADLEQAFPGLDILSSARGAVRAADGICRAHGLYLSSRAHCSDHLAAPAPAPPPRGAWWRQLFARPAG